VNEYEPEHEDAGAYVLSALSEEEQARFEAHLAGCATCRAEVAELQEVVDLLPLAAEQVEPDPALRGRIVDAIEAEIEHPALVPIVGGRPEPLRRFPWRLPEILAAAAAVLLIAGLGAWNIHLQQQINHYQTALSFQQQIARALASHASVSPITGRGSGRASSAALVEPAHGGSAYLVVQGLPATPSGRVYELWLFHGSKPEPSEVFTYEGGNAQIVKLPGGAAGYSQAAVTLERGPHGVRVPTGPIVLAGALHA
jgi:anti-sigma-K factor RskA